ncbi:MAG: hypothetical protein HYV76_02360 [Candidatus Vogelbacteria bacterium]|nr:hypothetical protein [Candidatus Vogelbacteria bacterium]
MTVIDNDQVREQIVRGLDLAAYSVSEQNQIIELLREAISSRVNVAIFEQLTTEEQRDLLELADQHNSQNVIEYVNNKIPDFEQLINRVASTTIAEFRNR